MTTMVVIMMMRIAGFHRWNYLWFYWSVFTSVQVRTTACVLFTYFKNIHLFLAALDLHCCTWAFSSCSEQALPSSCGARTSHCRSFSCYGAWALECRPSSCGSWAQLLCSRWEPPGPGIEPLSSALAGGFLTIGPPGKSHCSYFTFCVFYIALNTSFFLIVHLVVLSWGW